MQIFCDFDGTISVQDATDFILNRFALPEWEEIEEQWKRGLIGSGLCMQQQIALLQTSKKELDAALYEIEIDAGFVDFMRFCGKRDIPVTIISDGVDYFIRHILACHQLHAIPIIANRLTIYGDPEGMAQFRLDSPYADMHCASAAGVCKCRAIQSSHIPLVYVGDGRSDFCVSDKPDLVFAKGTLAEYCQSNDIAYMGYGSFFDVTEALRTVLSTSGTSHEIKKTAPFI